MRSPSRWILVVVSLVIAGGVAGWRVAGRRAARLTAPLSAGVAEVRPASPSLESTFAPAPAVIPADPVSPDEALPPKAPVPPEIPPPRKPAGPGHQPEGDPQQVEFPAPPVDPPAGGGLGDPLARVALAWVGMDEEAEAYWYDAINDPSLSAHERSDLIEDLNEDGLSDPRHPGAQDLPLIINRLRIIEWVAMDAMDEVNAEAFREAYKDLVNLAALVLGEGEPVR